MTQYHATHVEADELSASLLKLLARREPIQLDASRVSHAVSGRSVLVTGAGGSIGFALARAVLDFSPRSLTLLDNSENSLFLAARSLEGRGRDARIHPVLGDINDRPLLDEIFAAYAPELVFHAAAYKHVTLLEGQRVAAVRNNVCGTHAVIQKALEYGARRVVLLSTDKAVNPVSILGASKRAAELVAASLSTAETLVTSVRFGNVLWSRGSLLPLVAEQLSRRTPVMVTHPAATRYFLTAREAVNLLLDAAWLGAGGDVLLPELGRAVRVLDVVEALIRRAGLEPYEELPVVFTGLRPGEKLHEELYSPEETLAPTEAGRVFSITPPRMAEGRVDEFVSTLRESVVRRDPAALSEILRREVTEYRPQPGVHGS
jgi:FlaA1/EpsC-like NDP-sugar epimerase